MTFIKDLREKAEKASKGKWSSRLSDCGYSSEVWGNGCAVDLKYDNHEANADFIATANPQTVLWLLDVVEEFEKEAKGQIECEGYVPYWVEKLLAKLNQGPPTPEKEG